MAELSAREGRLDILVNNAGTNYNAKIDQHDFAMFEKVLHAAIYCHVAVLIAMWLCASARAAVNKPVAASSHRLQNHPWPVLHLIR